MDYYEYKTGYEVEKIIGHQYNKKHKWVLYLVKWIGYLEIMD
jgi:hypothetical protein